MLEDCEASHSIPVQLDTVGLGLGKTGFRLIYTTMPNFRVLWLLAQLCWVFPILALQSFVQQQPTRRVWLNSIVGVVSATALVSGTKGGTTASAADIVVVGDNNGLAVQLDAKAAAKEAVRVESTKGIAYMKAQLEAKDYDSLLEFTKSYDQILRKGAMGQAKKLMKESSSSSDVLTSITNAVTFDLIGINRSVRKGQENPEQAARYIQILQEDVNRFLSMD